MNIAPLLWKLRDFRWVRALYFSTPLPIRSYIRRKLIKTNEVVINTAKGIADELPETRILNRHLDNLNLRDGSIWGAGYLRRKKSEFSLSDTQMLDIDVYSFDIWDTAIGRFRPAESVKLSTALHISLADWSNRSFSGELTSAYKIYKVRNEIEAQAVFADGECVLMNTLFGIKKALNLNFDAETAHRYEVDGESLNTYPVDEVLNLFSGIQQSKLFISDFHLNNRYLNQILRKNGYQIGEESVFSSADCLKTKRNGGELFRHLENSLGERWVHVGDNPHSDWENSQKYGASVVKVKKESRNSWHGHHIAVDNLAEDLRDFLGNSEADKFLIDLSAISFALCTSAIQRAWQLHFDTVVYVSREGETLKKAHDLILKNNFFHNTPRIRAVHLPVSRTSVYFASWADDVELGFENLSIQYPVITAEGVLLTLGLPEAFRSLIMRNFGRYEQIRTSNVWARLDDEARRTIQSYLLNQRACILQFLKQEDIELGSSVLCDLGWRGSIQDSLERITNSKIVGQYLGLFRPYGHREGGESKFGLIFDENRNSPCPDFFTFFGPLERAFTLSPAQVNGYQTINGLISPYYSDSREYIQKDRIECMNKYFPFSMLTVANVFLSAGFFGWDTESMAKSVLKQWFLNPTRAHASCWFDELHYEGFGAGNVTHYSNVAPQDNWLGRSLRSVVKKGSESSLWPQGYLAWNPIFQLIRSVGNDS